MPFVERGDDKSAEHCESRPAEGPSSSLPRQGFSPRAKQEDAKQSVSDNVAGLTKEVVPWLEVRAVDPE